MNKVQKFSTSGEAIFSTTKGQRPKVRDHKTVLIGTSNDWCLFWIKRLQNFFSYGNGKFGKMKKFFVEDPYRITLWQDIYYSNLQ